MNRIVLAFSLLVILASCNNPSKNGSNNGQTSDTTSGAYLYIKEVTKDLGIIRQGDTAFCNFIVENRGKTDLLIKRVIPSCGCTGAKFEQKPIPPRGSGRITLILATNGREGKVSKSATVYANTIPETKVLNFSCEIVLPNKSK